jgi:hypothetical protein
VAGIQRLTAAADISRLKAGAIKVLLGAAGIKRPPAVAGIGIMIGIAITDKHDGAWLMA